MASFDQALDVVSDHAGRQLLACWQQLMLDGLRDLPIRPETTLG